MLLTLEDGSTIEGTSFGANKPASGEVVFNTGMVGYPETLTDPSYRGQILVLTYPLVGNYGVALSSLRGASHREQQSNLLFSATNNLESEKIQIAGLIVSEYCAQYSHPSAKQSLSQWLKSHGVPAIEGIDTRALTQKLRQKGTMLGKITNYKLQITNKFQNPNIKKQKFDDPNERNLAGEVSYKEPRIYEPLQPTTYKLKANILLYDCGVKLNIIRSLLARNSRVIRVPWNYELPDNFPISQFLNFSKAKIDGIVLSNGPGDPTKCDKTIEQIKKILTIKQCNNVAMPVLGICLGNQILALAAGAKTYKLKYGHRGQNQPVSISNLKSQISKPQLKSKNYKLISQFPNFPISNQNIAYITSQNHGYAVDEKTLKKDWSVWFKNLNDDTVEGIRHKSKPWMAVQFHPEAAPGPTDTEWIFDDFLSVIARSEPQ